MNIQLVVFDIAGTTVVDKGNNKVKQYPKVKFKNKSKLIPRVVDEEDTPEDLRKVFMTITMEVPENTNLASLSKKDILQGTLFSISHSFAERELQKIEGEKLLVTLDRPITVRYRMLQNGATEVSFEPLGISVQEMSSANAFDKFIDRFLDVIERDFMSEEPVNKSNYQYLESIVDDVQRITSQPDEDLPY